MDLEDRHAVLTGGSRGIGPYIAGELLDRGTRVTLAARSSDDLEKVKADLDGGRVSTVVADVTDPADRTGLIEQATAAFGPPDVLVNNAGVEVILPFTEYTEDDVHRIVLTNLESAIQLTRLVLPGMVERGRGHIVNISSVAGKAAVPFNVVYSSTKHGLVGLSYSLRAELRGTGVSASVVCPGYVTEAGMYARHATSGKPPSGTWTTPAKVGRAVVKAIEKDRPDVVVSGTLAKMSDVALALSPKASIAIAWRTGGYAPMKREAEATSASRASGN